MASEKNLNAVFSDIANSIRSKKGTTGTIQPVNMASEIDSIETGSNEKSTIYKGLEAKGTSWNYAFYVRSGYKCLFSYITEINESDFPPSSNVTTMSQMFENCEILTTVPLFDTSNVTIMYRMFFSCGELKTIPLFNTSKVTDMSYMFYDCGKLTSVPQLDASNVTDMNFMFFNCKSLTNIYMKNIKVSLDISTTALQHDALVELINNGLATITTTQTLTMGSTKLALLSDSEKQVALDKGWTLA